MQRIFLILLLLIFIAPVFAQRDTVSVQVFKFDDVTKRSDVVTFPDDDRRWEKIYMIRTLKCDERTTADKHPCGEWDRNTFTLLFIPDGDKKEVFELENFITPYGLGLDLNGDKGWTFTYDVTDYAPLLKGNVEIKSGNQQELQDMKFVFIEGIPARDILSVRNLYPRGNYNYGKLADDEQLQPFVLHLDSLGKGYKLRARISGHGHFGPRNCCEWDRKVHTYFGNEDVLFRWEVWKNCGDNPIFPQGGTWQFDRAGWCPGMPVDTYDFELTDKVNPGDSLVFDYGIEKYQENGEKKGNFKMSHQLITYGAPNFTNDAALVDVIAPTSKAEYSRVNPIINTPQVVIRNTGRHPLLTLTITYGLRSGKKQSYQWYGNLSFLSEEKVCLPTIDWSTMLQDPVFQVEISFPNGLGDEYEPNNYLTSDVVIPDSMPDQFYIHIESQEHDRARENGYQVIDSKGTVLYERDEFEDGKVYHDFIELAAGMYELRIFDRQEDGMIRHWWYRQSKPELVGRNGRIGLFDEKSKLLKELPFDFAEQVVYRFRVGDLQQTEAVGKK